MKIKPTAGKNRKTFDSRMLRSGYGTGPLRLGPYLAEEVLMFTRSIELTLKPNMKPEFFKKFKSEIVPIFKKTPGYFDLIVLEHDTEVNKLFFLSFWETKTNAEYYEREIYPKVKTIIEPFYTAPPLVRYWTFEETFSEKLFTKAMV